MKTKNVIWTLLTAALLVPAAQSAEIVTNRLSFSARLGFNISAKFKGNAGPLPVPPSSRTTPDGDPYNYDDGYVLTDVSGNVGGQTWYWGYDNSASQISGNNILLSRSAPNGNFSSPEFSDEPSLGCELTYNRHLLTRRGINFGFEAAVNYMNLGLCDNSTFVGTSTRTTDAYPFTPGTTPPAATPGNPYQGSFPGPGFVIGDTPVSSTSAVVPGGLTVSGRREFNADIFGLRLGPTVDFPLGTNFNIWLGGGMAVGWLNGDASWSDTLTATGIVPLASAGRGRHDEWLWGFYLAANVSWDFADDWSVVGSVQYQDLGRYEHNFGARSVQVDLSKSIFVTLGVSWRF